VNFHFVTKLYYGSDIYKLGTRHFNPLEDYRFFHHWFSGVKTP